ncbi:MAG: fatty acid desaturase [Paracoccaceae bacterium]
MDHTAFIKTLAPETRAALNQPSDAAGLRHLALHLGLIVATGSAIALRIPLWGLLLPVQGVLLVFLFTLEHECTHNTPFRSRWLNSVVGHGTGFILLLPFIWFRYFHLAHHKFTNDPANDPELAHPPITNRAHWLRHVSGLPYWLGQIKLIMRLAQGRAAAPYLPDRAKTRLQREALIMLAFYALALASLIVSPLLFWVWILPALLGQPALRLYLLAEHGDCPQVANMLENTRTTFTTRIMRFLAWNMPYHAEHHTLPQVPFHRLPDLHEHMRQHLACTANGYAAFTRTYLARRTP